MIVPKNKFCQSDDYDYCSRDKCWVCLIPLRCSDLIEKYISYDPYEAFGSEYESIVLPCERLAALCYYESLWTEVRRSSTEWSIARWYSTAVDHRGRPRAFRIVGTNLHDLAGVAAMPYPPTMSEMEYILKEVPHDDIPGEVFKYLGGRTKLSFTLKLFLMFGVLSGTIFSVEASDQYTSDLVNTGELAREITLWPVNESFRMLEHTTISTTQCHYENGTCVEYPNLVNQVFDWLRVRVRNLCYLLDESTLLARHSSSVAKERTRFYKNIIVKDDYFRAEYDDISTAENELYNFMMLFLSFLYGINSGFWSLCILFINFLYFMRFAHNFVVSTPLGFWIYTKVVWVLGIWLGYYVTYHALVVLLAASISYLHSKMIELAVVVVMAPYHIWSRFRRTGVKGFVREMILPGSKIEKFIGAKQPAVAALVVEVDGKWHYSAMCFRYENHLVSAFHPFAKHMSVGRRMGVAPNLLCKKRWTHDFGAIQVIDPSNYIVDFERHDVFMLHMSGEFWDRVRLPEPKKSVSNSFNDSATVFSYMAGTLHTSNGVLTSHTNVDYPPNNFMAHTCSTLPGFSGTPVFAANGAVRGVHIGSDNYEERNIMFRIDHIKYYLNKNKVTREDSSDFQKKVLRSMKRRKGKEAVYYFDDFDEDNSVAYDIRTGQIERVPRTEEEDEEFWRVEMQKPVGLWGDYEDAPISKEEEIDEVEPSQFFEVLDMRKKLHSPTPDTKHAETTEILEPFMDKFKELGYVEGMFEYPAAGHKMDTKSCVNAIIQHGTNVSECPVPITPDEEDRVVDAVSAMVQEFSFVVDPNYKSLEYFESIINTNQIEDRKSPGMPYLEEGMTTNAQVLDKLGVTWLYNKMIECWNMSILYRMFLKYEPTKKKKIDNWMARVILSFPLHKTLQNIVLFKNLLSTDAVHKGSKFVWYTFNPKIPGHIASMARRFLNLVTFSSDKETWDLSVRIEFYRMLARIVQNLCKKHPDMTVEAYKQVLLDIYDTIMQVGAEGEYRLNNGYVLKAVYAGYLKSGWYLTIIANSIMQVVVHVLACFRCGMSFEEIIDLPFVAGGDDVIQHLPDHIVDRYIEAHASFGIKLKLERHESFEGSEFFSNRFFLDSKGKWYFVPQRFCKHIESLLHMKPKDLFQGLSSKLDDWCFKDEVSQVFEDIMSVIRTKYKHLYVPSVDKTRREAINQARGYEDLPINAETAIACDSQTQTDEKVEDGGDFRAEFEAIKKEMRQMMHTYRMQIDALTSTKNKLQKKVLHLETQLVTAKLKNKGVSNNIGKRKKDVNSQSSDPVLRSPKSPVGATVPTVDQVVQPQSGGEVFPPLPRDC
ncbi:replicase [Changjiang sobemo-like virus 2]|uniref:replicase n=1 Tax=Changjiang sobemo-like virus 2 TaxID=1922801 RepID=UPI00090BBA50|nr:replicase [Changjiang sobemo-like virus 2]APG75731.1 replicase [Changjiang sobemo-like virus 2]